MILSNVRGNIIASIQYVSLYKYWHMYFEISKGANSFHGGANAPPCTPGNVFKYVQATKQDCHGVCVTVPLWPNGTNLPWPSCSRGDSGTLARHG